MMLVNDILYALVCPISGHKLRIIDNRLVCDESGFSYPIIDGVPVLLAEFAVKNSTDKEQEVGV